MAPRPEGNVPIIRQVVLPCGCMDVYYKDGTIDREHDYVICDGEPRDLEPLTRPFDFPFI